MAQLVLVPKTLIFYTKTLTHVLAKYQLQLGNISQEQYHSLTEISKNLSTPTHVIYLTMESELFDNRVLLGNRSAKTQFRNKLKIPVIQRKGELVKELVLDSTINEIN